MLNAPEFQYCVHHEYKMYECRNVIANFQLDWKQKVENQNVYYDIPRVEGEPAKHYAVSLYVHI